MLTVPCMYLADILHIYKKVYNGLRLWGAGQVLVLDLGSDYTGYHPTS